MSINFEGREINLQSDIDQIKNQLICLLCKNLPVRPKLILTCSHNFCDTCIANKNVCPVCNNCFTAEKLLNNIYFENMIRCIFHVEDILNEAKSTNVTDINKASCSKTNTSNEQQKFIETPKLTKKANVTSDDQEIDRVITEKEKNKLLNSPKAKSVILEKPRTARKRSLSVCSRKSINIEVKDQKHEENVKTKENPKNINFPNGLANIPCLEYIWISSRKLKEISKTRNNVGETLLHKASIKGNIEVTKKYVENFMNVNVTDNYNWTPLHEAVRHKQLEIVKILLNAGAIVNVPSKTYETPLHLAVENSSSDIAIQLLKYGAAKSAKTIEGYTPLDTANEMLKRIVEKTEQVIAIPPTLTIPINIEAVSETIKTNKQVNSEQFSIKVSKNLLSNTSFLIVSQKEIVLQISYVFLYAILKGFWIVNEDWYHQCSQLTEFVDPSEYEIIGTDDYPKSYAPKKGRLCRLLLGPGLFDGCHFYVYGNKYVKGKFVLTRQEIIDLITAGNGQILKRCPAPEFISPKKIYPYHARGKLERCTHYIIYTGQPYQPEYRFPEIHTLSVQWLLNCIQQFRLDFQ